MPMHDWTRVSAGVFHHFHNAWITHLSQSLNSGCLPAPYYAMGEQRSGGFGPDVLTLKDEYIGMPMETAEESAETLVAVAAAPPAVAVSQEAAEDINFYLAKQRNIAIRHVTDDRVVAFIEIVSPANRHTQENLDDFTDKVVACLREGIHVLVIDPFPPGRYDKYGIHCYIWERTMAGTFEPPEGLPLTLASYCARSPLQAWVEPTAVGSELIDMPLFLTPDHYVNTPLESTYTQAWAGVPKRWQRVIVAEAE